MKRLFYIFFLLSGFSFSSHSQWITLYEGGSGTANSLAVDWSERYYVSGNGTTNSVSITGSWNDANRMKMLYYLSDFGHGTAGMYKTIPGLENYASVRVYLEMDLPDSIGIIHYAALTDDLFADSLNNSLCDEFASDQLGVTIPYSNTAGHNTMYFYADLLRGDSVWMWFNYVRIEVDTTQMLGISPLANTDYAIYSSDNLLVVQPENEGSNFTIHLFNAIGTNVFQGSFSGKQTFPMEVESGAYFVQITDESGRPVRQKVYLE